MCTPAAVRRGTVGARRTSHQLDKQMPQRTEDRVYRLAGTSREKEMARHAAGPSPL